MSGRSALREDVQLEPAVVPVQRVAGEEPPVVDVEDDRALGVARHRDGDGPRRDGHRVGAVEDHRGVGSGVRVGGMDPHLCAVVLGPPVGVGNVVAMTEQHVPNPAEVVDSFGEAAQVAGRVDHEVAAGPF